VLLEQVLYHIKVVPSWLMRCIVGCRPFSFVLQLSQQFILETCIVSSAGYQPPDQGHAACSGSHAQEAIAPLLLDYDIRHLMDKIRHKLPVLVS
jgi:hypothetical protein